MDEGSMTSTPDPYVQVNRQIVGPDCWRDTTYEGPDGHRVRVVLPRRVHLSGYPGEMHPTHYDYDEDAERSMLAQLMAGHVGEEQT